jgi:hypothetical protein
MNKANFKYTCTVTEDSMVIPQKTKNRPTIASFIGFEKSQKIFTLFIRLIITK